MGLKRTGKFRMGTARKALTSGLTPKARGETGPRCHVNCSGSDVI